MILKGIYSVCMYVRKMSVLISCPLVPFLFKNDLYWRQIHQLSKLILFSCAIKLNTKGPIPCRHWVHIYYVGSVPRTLFYLTRLEVKECWEHLIGLDWGSYSWSRNKSGESRDEFWQVHRTWRYFMQQWMHRAALSRQKYLKLNVFVFSCSSTRYIFY